MKLVLFNLVIDPDNGNKTLMPPNETKESFQKPFSTALYFSGEISLLTNVITMMFTNEERRTVELKLIN